MKFHNKHLLSFRCYAKFFICVVLFNPSHYPIIVKALKSTESWVPKKWCFWTVVLEKTLESTMDYEIKPVNPKGNWSWLFIGRTYAEAETPVLWPPDAKNCFIRKDPDTGQDWKQEENGMTEDEIVRWHHWLSGWIWASSGSWWSTGKPGVLQSSWGHKESDMTEQLNWTDYAIS